MTTTAAEVRERPIIFSAPMVRAILEGRKTQTRRVMQIQPSNDDAPHIDVSGPRFNGCIVARWPGESEFDGYECHCPFGAPADRLWVRERFYIDHGDYLTGALPSKRPPEIDDNIYYRADGDCCDQIPECSCAEIGKPKWRSTIHMPRWASRITLKITDVRVQQLRKISVEDARAEGWTQDANQHPYGWYRDLWDQINGDKHPWASNPWVWAITFRRIEAKGGLGK